MDTPSDIPTYLSLVSVPIQGLVILRVHRYYVIIQWIWATQTYYDIRFQAEDVVHRVYKAAQICLFVYIGAAAGNWNLAKIRDPDSVPSIDADDYETHREASTLNERNGLAHCSARCGEFYHRSSRLHRFPGPFSDTVFNECGSSYSNQTTLILVGAILAKQAHRKMGLQISSAMKLILSTVISVVALALPATSTPLRAVKVRTSNTTSMLRILSGRSPCCTLPFWSSSSV